MATALAPVASPTVPVDLFGRSWEGRRVVVLGLGRSGVAASMLLRRAGAHVTITERRDTPELRTAKASLEARGIEQVELGLHTRQAIDEAELVITSPGIPETSELLQWATARQLPILSEIELAFYFCPSPVIAVTGTNGKSTAVTLIAAILQASGTHAIACGNLGIPFASIVEQLTPQSVAVVEVSSFQLLGCEWFRPTIGLLLNIGTNHLDRHQDRAAYMAAKARLFQCQLPDDWAVLNGADPNVVAMAEALETRKVWFGENRSNPPQLRLAPQTCHALPPNVQAVLQVARLMGIPDPLSWQVIREFRGLEHRLEFVATIRGIHFVNDSKSTTPESLLFALSRTPGPVVVVVGGRDKGLDFETLVEPLHQARVKGVVLMGESRARLRPLLNGATTVRECTTLPAAVETAAALASPGTTVLFSPACASFDMFRNFEERGQAFKAMVHSLGEQSQGGGR